MQKMQEICKNVQNDLKHSSKCRFFYNFKLKQPLTKKISSGYKEENDINESEQNYEEVIDEDEIEKEVNSQINRIFERPRRNMLQRINDLLFK